MFDKFLITIEVGSRDIKILAGNKNKVKCFGTVKTPEDTFTDDKIVDVIKLANTISAFLKDKGIRMKEVSFVIHGPDIVIRHMETPIMDRKGIWKSLEWEVSQYLPDAGVGYYSDYEITDKIVDKEKKVYKLMVVSSPKEKINKYMELAQKLKLKLIAIDIAPNSMCRVFRNVQKYKKDVESIGIIQLGISTSTLTIVEKGRLFIERELPFGLNNVAREMYTEGNNVSDDVIARFLREFSFRSSDEDSISGIINSLFNDLFITFEKVIQFYTTGKAKKTLDMIYITGEGSDINGIDSYVQRHFGTSAEVVVSSRDIGINIKLPKDCNFRSYVNTIGLMLRKD